MAYSKKPSKKVKEAEEEKTCLELKLYLQEKYEKDAREKNQYEKLKSDREIHKAFDIMKHYCQTKDTIEKMNGVKKSFQDLYEKFESTR